MCRGVSHTPSMAGMLHVRRGYFVRRYHSVFAHIRAYAIRPYTCSFKNDALLGYALIPFPLTSGRMRYAPTPVRLLTWLNTVNHYTCSIKNDALLGDGLFPFSPTSGRMRYAPTVVRLFLGLNTVNHYPRSMGIHTKKTAYYVSTTPWQKKNLFH